LTEIEAVTLEAELTDDIAESEIETAVKGRHSVARKYVLWVRRRNPEATPSEVIAFLERHYIAAITVAGGLVSAGSMALDVGISLIPGGGVAKSATKHVARGAAKAAAKAAAKQAALEARTAVGEALTELQLLTDNPRVLELADTLVDITFTLHEAPDRADRDRRGHLARAAHNTFVAAAGPLVRA